MQIFGPISIVLLFILPIISLQSLRAMKEVNVASKTYLETISAFAMQKMSFQKLQKLNVSLGMALMVIAIRYFQLYRAKILTKHLIFGHFFFRFLFYSFWYLPIGY